MLDPKVQRSCLLRRLETYAEEKFFGEVLISFHNGNITVVKQTQTFKLEGDPDALQRNQVPQGG